MQFVKLETIKMLHQNGYTEVNVHTSNQKIRRRGGSRCKGRRRGDAPGSLHEHKKKSRSTWQLPGAQEEEQMYLTS